MPAERAAATPVALPVADSASVQSQGGGNLQEVHTITGRCTQLLIGGEDLTEGCEPRLVNAVHRSGRSGFTFAIGDLAVFTVSGAGDNVKSRTEIIQPIDETVWSLLGAGTDPIWKDAVGSCAFGDPYSGRATIRCSGRTEDGEFVATFVTDGKPPSSANFRH